MRIARSMNGPSKRFQKNGDRSAVAMLKITRQLGSVCQDMESPKSSSILRKSSDIRKPIRCVKFTKAVVRHANIRDQNPSLGMICPGEPHQRKPNATKFEDRSQGETERQERCAREAAWKLAKSVLKFVNNCAHTLVVLVLCIFGTCRAFLLAEVFLTRCPFVKFSCAHVFVCLKGP